MTRCIGEDCGQLGSNPLYPLVRIFRDMNFMHTKPTMLILDEDAEYAAFLGKNFINMGFSIVASYDASHAIELIDQVRPQAAVLELVIGEDSGLDVLEHLTQECPKSRAVILTGYGDISTAVSAVKLGAVDYLIKPATPEEIHGGLQATATARSPLPAKITQPKQAQFEHILLFLRRNDYKLAPTARQLGMHRRTLQRILRRHGIQPLTLPAK